MKAGQKTQVLLRRLAPEEGLKSTQGFRFIGVDFEDPVEFGDLKNFVDFRPNTTEFQRAAACTHPGIQRNQFSQGSTGKKLDPGEIEENFLAIVHIHQAEQFLAPLLDADIFDDFLVPKSDHGDIPHLGYQNVSIFRNRS